MNLKIQKNHYNISNSNFEWDNKHPLKYVLVSSIPFILILFLILPFGIFLTFKIFPNTFQFYSVIILIYLPMLFFILPQFGIYFSKRKVRKMQKDILFHSADPKFRKYSNYKVSLPANRYLLITILTFFILYLLADGKFGQITQVAWFLFPFALGLMMIASLPLVLIKYKFQWHSKGFYDVNENRFILSGNVIYPYLEMICKEQINKIALKFNYNRFIKIHYSEIYICTDDFSLQVAKFITYEKIEDELYQSILSFFNQINLNSSEKTNLNIFRINNLNQIQSQKLFFPIGVMNM